MNVQRHLVIVSNQVAFNNGSVANIARQHLHYLREYFQLTVMASYIDDETIGFCKENNIHIVLCKPYQLNFLRRWGHAVREWLLCQKYKTQLKQLHQKQPVDFILCHSHTAAYIAARPLQKFGVKFAVMTHGNIFIRTEGTYDGLLTFLYKVTTIGANNHADAVIVLSESMVPLLKKSQNKDNVFVIPNGISSVENASQNNSNLSLRKKSEQSITQKLLWVGSFTSIKNPIMMVHVFSKIVQNYDGLLLDMVGDGPLLEDCKQLVRSLKLQECVKFHYNLPHPSVLDLYLKKPIFCLTSENESLPTVILEAMINDCPVVATNIVGVNDLIHHKIDGLLCERNDIDTMSHLILDLLQNEKRAKKFTYNARMKVLSEYSWPSVAQKFETVITSLLSVK